MIDAYHPGTFEHIPTDAPADWMLRAGVAAPTYNPATAGCFWRNGAWEIISSAPSMLAAAQADRIAYIEEQYELSEHADIVYMGATFQAGDESQKLIDRVLAAQNGAAPAGFGWYDITNTKVPLTNAELQGLAAAIFLRNQPLFDNKQAKKAAIRAAATAAEVEAITW